MATVISFNTAKSMVISLLQASQTPYATTVDGSNRQYSSDTEIANAILNADTEVCTLIAKTMQSPFQSTFVQTSSALANGANLPARNGVILNVLTQNGTVDIPFSTGNVSPSTDSFDLAGTTLSLVPLQKVRFTTSGTLPGGLSAGVDYWITASSAYPDYQFATSYINAYNDAAVEISSIGSGNSTIVMTYEVGIQTDSKDTVLETINNVIVFANKVNYTYNYWFIEGDTIYTTSPYCKVVYTDYTLTSSPQSPEPYLFAVVAGALSKLLKDGSDSSQLAFYTQQYQAYLTEIASGARVIPEIVEYK